MIIALTGKMGSGKSTVTEIIGRVASTKRIGFKLVKFAQPLYDIQSYMYERTGLRLKGPKDRKLLQWLGTEWGREKDENLWVNIWKREVQRTLEFLAETGSKGIVVCDDCRFDNEAAIVKSLGGKVINITADEETRSGRIPLTNTAHSSESGIHPVFIDYQLGNTGSIRELESKVEAMLTEFDKTST